jgi:hypothetical protein
MRHDQHSRTGIACLSQRRQRSRQAGVIGHPASFDRHIQIFANQNSLTG